MANRMNTFTVSTSDCFFSSNLFRIFAKIHRNIFFLIFFSFSLQRFRVQLSKLFIDSVPTEDLHKPDFSYKVILRYILQKHPNLVHVIDDVRWRKDFESVEILLIFVLGWKSRWFGRFFSIVHVLVIYNQLWKCCKTLPLNFISRTCTMNQNVLL